ncbi:MAG: 4Fe-4S dicluster domain-containing protein [Sulfurospirillum sp.]
MSDIANNLFVYTDPDRCMGCHSCEIACATSHSDYDLQTSVLMRIKSYPSRNTVIKVGNLTTVIQCVSCDAPCIDPCPIDVINRYDEFGGVVKIDEENCIGCKACAKACPYDVIKMVDEIIPPEKEIALNGKKKKRKKKKALKCDLCFDKKGENGEFNPACVTACPTEAIILTSDDLLRTKALKMAGYL